MSKRHSVVGLVLDCAKEAGPSGYLFSTGRWSAGTMSTVKALKRRDDVRVDLVHERCNRWGTWECLWRVTVIK